MAKSTWLGRRCALGAMDHRRHRGELGTDPLEMSPLRETIPWDVLVLQRIRATVPYLSFT